MTTHLSKQKQKTNNPSSETALFDEEVRHLSSRKGSNKSIALVCDWLTTPGGAEKVLLELHHLYPEAPIYTSQYSKKGINWFDDATVKTGWLQIFPSGLRKILGPFRQLYFSHLDLTSYDLVISVTGAEAKSVKAKKHLCYCHVPTQYYWQMYDKYLENPGFGIFNPLVRFAFKLLIRPLRSADYRAAQKPTQFVTISNYAKEQIQKYYHREAIVIAPPVEVEKFVPVSYKASRAATPKTNFSTAKTVVSHSLSTVSPQDSNTISTENDTLSTSFPQQDTNISTKNTNFSTHFPHLFHKKHQSFPQKTPKFSTDNADHPSNPFPKYHYLPNHPHQTPEIIFTQSPQYYIITCRQVTWKHVDLAIEGCLKAEVPLLVVGDGSEHNRLLKLANDSRLIKFLPWTPTSELAEYIQHAKAYLFPSLEPFGIAAVEALAAGCPVIAFAEGGSQDFIQPGKNGVLFSEQTVTSITEAIKDFERDHKNLQSGRPQISASAQKFSTQHFDQHIKQIVKQLITTSKSKRSTP